MSTTVIVHTSCSRCNLTKAHDAWRRYSRSSALCNGVWETDPNAYKFAQTYLYHAI